MLRNGEEIERHPLKNRGKDSGITYSQSFAQWEAANGAGLNLWDWDNNIYPNSFKAKVMEWWKLHNLVQVHVQDANTPNRKGKK